jgi:hypothetical protein
MLMLAEPTIYLLISIADYADIEDYVLYNEEDEDEINIPEDGSQPINMDEEETEKPKIEPREETVGKGLLARIKQELPGKVEEAKGMKEEEEEK